MNLREKTWEILKEAISVNNRAFPWERAIGAGIAMALPIFIGIWLDQLQYGLIAGLGGFTYLYAFRLPYAHLSKRLFFVAVSIVIASLLGSLLAPFPLAVAIVMGIISAVMLFIFNALKFIGPSSIFFVLIFAITADMPQTDLIGSLIRSGLIAIGAGVSWLIAMSGFLLNPHRPEIQVVKRTYQQLIKMTQSIGSEKFSDEKYRTMGAFKEAVETLIAGELPWKPRETYTRLLHLAIEGNEYFLYLMNQYAEKNHSEKDHAESPLLPAECITFLQQIEQSLAKNLKNLQTLDHTLQVPTLSDKKLERYFERMKAALTSPVESLKPVTLERRDSIKDILSNAFDRNSLVFLTALRFGVMTSIAAFIAYSFEFTRSYWIPLSCVAVMSGASMIATFHRALQRSIGTFIGIIIASCILYFKPSGYPIALFILFFTATIELFIVKNYGLAVIFITPNALLLAETITGGEFSFFHFSTARMIDVVIGSAIGLIGVILMNKRSASLRIPRILMRTLRNQSQMILLLFSKQRPSTDQQINSRLIKMRTNLANLTALYDAAIGEIPQKRELIEYYWPIIYSMEKLAFLLERAAETEDRPTLSEPELASLLYLFETLANSAKFSDIEAIKKIPEIPGFHSIEREIDTLQKAFLTETKISPSMQN